MPNLNIKIDVTKILKEHLFPGKNGAKYLDLTVWENRDGEDRFGHTHMVVQSLPKELRDAGQKGPILGNGKTFGQPGRDRTPQDAYKAKHKADKANGYQRDNSGSEPDDSDSIPFAPKPAPFQP